LKNDLKVFETLKFFFRILCIQNLTMQFTAYVTAKLPYFALHWPYLLTEFVNNTYQIVIM